MSENSNDSQEPGKAIDLTAGETAGTPEEPETEKTPVAVALQYEPDKDGAPRVVAGGRGSIAEQIMEIAFAQGVKVREDPDLAELLSAIDIESEIPVEAFAAVAEILIYVYRANGTPFPFESNQADKLGPTP